MRSAHVRDVSLGARILSNRRASLRRPLATDISIDKGLGHNELIRNQYH